jgi:hypothetical protein
VTLFVALYGSTITTPIAAVSIVKISNSTVNDAPGSTDMSILPA